VALLTDKGVANSNLDNIAMPQSDLSAITTSSPFSLKIPKSDNTATLDEEVQGAPIPSPSSKRSRSLSGLSPADDYNSD
jgi:hypothetical protein